MNWLYNKGMNYLFAINHNSNYSRVENFVYLDLYRSLNFSNSTTVLSRLLIRKSYSCLWTFGKLGEELVLSMGLWIISYICSTIFMNRMEGFNASKAFCWLRSPSLIDRIHFRIVDLFLTNHPYEQLKRE